MKVTAEKATISKNGGYVVTLTNEQEVKTVLGTSVRKSRFLFKCLEDITGLVADIDLKDFDIVPIKSVNEDTGEEFTNNWLMPKVA